MAEKLITLWDDKHNVVHTRMLTESGQRITRTHSIEPYFFVKTSDVEKARDTLQDFTHFNRYNSTTISVQFDYHNEGEYTRVTYSDYENIVLWDFFQQVQQTLQIAGVQDYELDLKPSDLLLVNNDVNISDEYRVLFFDIETKDTQGGIEIGRDRILSICAVDAQGKEYVCCDDSERLILQQFLDVANNYDVIVGWNCLDEDTELISKTRGIITMRDANIGELIATGSGYKKIKAKRQFKANNCKTLHLRTGQSVVGTQNHRLLCFDNGKYVYKKIKDITTSDFLINKKVQYRKNAAITKYSRIRKYNISQRYIPKYFAEQYRQVIACKNNDYIDNCKLRKLLTFKPHFANRKWVHYTNLLSGMQTISDNLKLLSNTDAFYKLDSELKICEDVEYVTIRKITDSGNKNVVDIEMEDGVFIANGIISHNSKKFDLPYLKSRCQQHGLYFATNQIIHLDLMTMFRESFAVKVRVGQKFLTSYSLNNVAKAFINDSKLEVGGEEGYGGRLWKLFNEDRDKLIKYNLQDCKLMLRLDTEFNLIRNAIEVAMITGTPLRYITTISKVIDVFTLRIARKKSYHFRSKDFKAEKAHYEGAYVIEARPAMYKNIHVYDYKSMYASIVRTFNISPDTILPSDTKEPYIETPNGIKFSTKRGIIPNILDELTALRYKYRDEQSAFIAQGDADKALEAEFRQTAIKVVILSYYGIMGSAFSRFFNLDVAEAITLTAQYLIKGLEKNLVEMGYDVVFGDTDSVGVQFDKNVTSIDKMDTILADLNNKLLQLFIFSRSHKLVMTRERELNPFIVLAKKKYVGRCIWKDGTVCDELYWRGIELQKGSELLLTKELLKKVLNMILYDDASADEIAKIILSYRKKIVYKQIDNVDKITIIKKVGRMPNEYVNLPAHVELAVKMQEQGMRFYTSMRVPFIVVSEKPLKIVHRSEYAGDYDTRYYWEKQVYPPVFRLLNVVFPDAHWNKYEEGTLDIQNVLADYV